MNDTLVVITDGAGLAYVRAMDDPEGRLRYLQRGYPRDLRIIYREDGAGHLASRVLEHFSNRRLRGWWLELPDAAHAVQDALRELRAADHDHAATYSNKILYRCSHPGCLAARREYLDSLKARRRAGDWSDRRKKAPAGEAGQDGQHELPAAGAPEPALGLAPDLLLAPEAHSAGHQGQHAGAGVEQGAVSGVVADGVGVADQLVAGVTPEAAPLPEKAGPGDEGRVLAYLRRFTMPNRQVFSGIADINFIATATSLDPDRVAVAVRELLKSRALVKRGDDLFLGTR